MEELNHVAVDDIKLREHGGYEAGFLDAKLGRVLRMLLHVLGMLSGRHIGLPRSSRGGAIQVSTLVYSSVGHCRVGEEDGIGLGQTKQKKKKHVRLARSFTPMAIDSAGWTDVLGGLGQGRLILLGGGQVKLEALRLPLP